MWTDGDTQVLAPIVGLNALYPDDVSQATYQNVERTPKRTLEPCFSVQTPG